MEEYLGTTMEVEPIREILWKNSSIRKIRYCNYDDTYRNLYPKRFYG